MSRRASRPGSPLPHFADLSRALPANVGPTVGPAEGGAGGPGWEPLSVPEARREPHLPISRRCRMPNLRPENLKPPAGPAGPGQPLGRPPRPLAPAGYVARLRREPSESCCCCWHRESDCRGGSEASESRRRRSFLKVQLGYLLEGSTRIANETRK